MKRSITILTGALWLIASLLPIPLKAQLQFTSLQEVLDYADEHALTIRNAETAQMIATSEKKEARNALLPSASASLGYNDNITMQPTLVPAEIFNPQAPEGTYEELRFGTKYMYTGGVYAQWDILSFQKIFALQTAGIVEEQSGLTTQMNKFNTYNQLASTYYSILLTHESIRIYEENLRTSSAILDHTREKYQEGILSEAEANQAEIKNLQNKRMLSQATHSLDQLYIQFQGQLNTNQSILVHDTPGKTLIVNSLISSEHPEVLWQEAEVLKYESIVKQNQALRLPTVSLTYQNYQNWATDNFMDFGNSRTLPQQAFGVRISIPIIGSSTHQKVKQSNLNLQLQQQQLENTRLIKQQEDALLQLQLEQASDQLEDNLEILALQQQNDLHAENQYQKGVTSLTRRLDHYNDLLAVQDQYLQSLAEWTLAQYKIYIRQK